MAKVTNVKFFDYSEDVKSAIAGCAETALEECAGELESAVKRNTKVGHTGQTKGSWEHKVAGSMMAGQWEATVGSNYENAIWEEYGTGDLAENGGRKGGWNYWDDQLGRWVHTHGKQARRPFRRAWDSLKQVIIKHLQDSFKGIS